jgi:hypothetical protein
MMITVNQLEWNSNGFAWLAEKSCSIITPSIAESGAVMCYVVEDGEYLPVPNSISWGDYTTHVVYTYNPGNIQFMVQDDDGYTPNPGQVVFKVVAISSAGMKLNPDLDINNYQAVKQAFDLEE